MLFLFAINLISALILSSNEAAKILAVFPTPSISHQLVFRTLTQRLAQLGHQVTVVTPDPAFLKEKSPPNLTEIDVGDVSRKKWIEGFVKAPKGRNNLVTQVERALETIALVVDAQLQNEDIQKLINDKNNAYDLLLLEAVARSTLVYSHIFKAPVITISSLGALPWDFNVIGAPEHPILYPSVLRSRLYNLTTWEKFFEVYTRYQMQNIVDKQIKFENKILQKRFPNMPNIVELNNNIDMFFINSYPAFGGILPVPPNVVFTGGLHQNPTKTLPSDLKNYLDSSKNGIIYVSFGTNVDPNLLPPKKVQDILSAFSKLPYNVLFKWNDENLSGYSDNIKVSKWLPQSDLLKHPNVKLFITQGGIQSTEEAITARVPMIGIPMAVDQWYNTENYVHHGIGIQLDFGNLTEKTLLKSINTVIEDESYRRNINKLHNLITDEPMTPLDRAVWWIEYVLRHGGAKHLRSPTANISWSEYLQLDLVVLVLLIFISLVILSGGCLYFLYRCFTINRKIKVM